MLDMDAWYAADARNRTPARPHNRPDEPFAQIGDAFSANRWFSTPMTSSTPSKNNKKSRRIRRGIAAVVIAAAGIGGVVAGPLGGTSHAGTTSAQTAPTGGQSRTAGIFW